MNTLQAIHLLSLSLFFGCSSPPASQASITGGNPEAGAEGGSSNSPTCADGATSSSTWSAYPCGIWPPPAYCCPGYVCALTSEIQIDAGRYRADSACVHPSDTTVCCEDDSYGALTPIADGGAAFADDGSSGTIGLPDASVPEHCVDRYGPGRTAICRQ